MTPELCFPRGEGVCQDPEMDGAPRLGEGPQYLPGEEEPHAR